MIEEVEQVEPAQAATAPGAILMFDPRELQPDPHNERGAIGPDTDPDLEGLVESVKAVGILEPLRVYWNERVKRYVISSGHRRRAAAMLAGLEEVPCYVVDHTDLAGPQRDIERLVSNVQRRDIDDMSKARTIKALREGHPELTQAELAAKLGMSQPALANLMRLLRLPAEVQELIAAGKLSRAHGLQLLRVEEPVSDYQGHVTPTEEWRKERAASWAERGLSVREAEFDTERELNSQKWIRQHNKQQEEWRAHEAAREAKQAGVTPEELEAKRKEERRQSIIEGRARTKRVRTAQAALMDAVRVFRDQDIEGGHYLPMVELQHIRFMALSLNRGYLMADTRRAWGLPSMQETHDLIMLMREREEMLTWCARLAMAHMLEVSYDGKGFRTSAAAWDRDPVSELADATWGISGAIKAALDEADPARLANRLGGE